MHPKIVVRKWEGRVLLSGLVFLSLHFSANAATYYVDYVGGSDANNGTSQATPWQLAPGMTGFAGTYIPATSGAGDRIIFKGGVTWPNPSSGSPFPFTITPSSAAAYYGIDTTWFSGGSFSRPIFDMQNQVVASTNVAILLNANGVTIDNLEITNLYWTGSAQAGAILLGAAGDAVLSNLYIHNWTHDTMNGTQDVFHAVASSPTAQGGLYTSEITGFPGSTTSGTGVFNIPYVSSCSIHDLSNGVVVPNGIEVTVVRNRIFNIHPSFDGATVSQAVMTTGVTSLAANYIHDFTNASEGIVTQPSHSNVLGSDAYYDNLIWNTGSKTPFILDTAGPTATTSNPFFLNNTIVQDTNGYCLAVGKNSSGTLGILTIENNQCVSDKSSSIGMLCVNSVDGSCAAVTSETSLDNILETQVAASTNGYTLSDLFSPTASTSPTVGAGVFNSIVNSLGDIRGAARPFGSPFDVGAYQYCAGCGAGPVNLPIAFPGTTNNSGTVPATIDFDASQSTAPGATIIRYDWTFGDGASALGLTGPTTSHTYISVGNFISSVTITTNLGAQATGWGVIVVKPRAAGLAVGNAQAQAGTDVSLDLTLTPSPDVGISALEFDLILPATVIYNTTTAGPAALAAGKATSENPAIPRVLIAGFNQNVIGAGVVATVHLHVAPGTPAGMIPISLANVNASDPTGLISIPLNGTSGSITVPQPTVSLPSTPAPVFSPRVYPNPWRSDQAGGKPITFDQLTGNTTIKVFTASGRLVTTLTTSGSVGWPLTNDSGDKVASGLYFYLITDNLGDKATGELVVIK